MRWQTRSAWLLIPWLALACGDAAQEAAQAPEPAVPISGLYKVTGKTVSVASGDSREISGTVILNETEAGYTATFSLVTTAPGADQAMPAEIIGTGKGSVEGRTLIGTADTQLVVSTVPGIDPGFAFIPRMVSTRITSKSSAVVSNDGSVTIEIENEASPGQEYLQTRTSLHGRRIGDAAIGGPQPPVVGGAVYDDLEDYDPADYVDEDFAEDDEG
jgi:hypothetical protein